jgi:transcriptional regulator with XRE-family HTH domain
LPFLKGDIRDRIVELAQRKGENMEKLAQCVGITGSQMSRIINGKTLKVSHELVIAIAAEFDVSTDFLLGLTSIPDRTRLDELGLSEKAIWNLVSGRVNRKCINHLLEDEELIRLMNNAKPVNKISDDRSEEH